MFDGPIDPQWFESLNTVLDDTQTLTLANSDRIKINSNMRLLFETSDLTNVTASTVSRLGIVNFSLNND